MLDVLSVILAIIGLLQNSSKGKDQNERLDLLIQASEKMTKLHEYLEEAKGVHDDFENMFNQCLAVTKRDVARSRGSINELVDAMTQFFIFEKALIKTREILEDQHSDKADIPDIIPVKGNISKTIRQRNELAQGFANYEEAKANLFRLVEDRTFGALFERGMINIEDQARRVLMAADQIILNSVPIIKFFHYQLHIGLTELRPR